MTEAYIYDAVRTPRGKGRKDGSLHEVPAVRLSSIVLNSLKERNNLDAEGVEDVIWGNVHQVGEQGACLARSAVLQSEFGDALPGVSVNRFCASGLEAVNMAANQVRGGDGDGYIAGGVESMSRVPMGSDGGALAVDPAVAIPAYMVPQGISADIIATEYGISREDADSYSVESQNRAAGAWADRRFDKSIIAVKDINGATILDHDEHMRPGTTVEGLSGLKPSFKEQGETMPGFNKIALMKYPHLEKIEHIHHAGNSSGIVDGAAGIVIGNKEFGEKYGLKPRARFVATAKIGSDPTIMLTGPVPVTEKILARAGMTTNDIDLYELNEAFASVVLRWQRYFDIDMDKLNVNGGAIAMGHPMGATGAIILGTLLDEMERADKATGLATLCIGAGMGSATIIERV
ncbi:MAG: acetyl-CoA C-acetyltransferase [Silicimonas sp.]|nr:acetyl-CoA C-acetyltransferase [Silicimonas sp.]